MKHILLAILIASILTTILVFNIAYIPLFKGDENVIDRGWAIFSLGLLFVVWKSSKYHYVSIVGKIGFWMAINNFLDEFFFDPLEVIWPEYTYGIIVIVTILYETWHRHRMKVSTQK